MTGHRSQFEPFLNETTLHDNTPDQRRTENIPRLELIKNMTYDKKGRIKSSLHSDGVRFKEVIDVLSQF